MRDHFDVHRWADPAPRVALLAIPEDGPPQEGNAQFAVAAVHAWVRGWQHLMDHDAVTPIPPRWLHITLAGLGPAATAPAGLDEAIEAEMTGPRGAAGLAPHDRILLPITRTGQTGISAEIGGIGDVDLSMLGADACAIAERAGVAAAEVSFPMSPHLGMAYGRRDQEWPWRKAWSARITPPPCYLRLRPVLVNLVQDLEHRCYTWQVRRALPFVLRSSTTPDVAAIVEWEQATPAIGAAYEVITELEQLPPDTGGDT